MRGRRKGSGRGEDGGERGQSGRVRSAKGKEKERGRGMWTGKEKRKRQAAGKRGYQKNDKRTLRNCSICVLFFV